MKMNYKPVPPIFVIEGDDVGIFATLGDAQLQLEPEDVRTTEYHAYDSAGVTLRVAATAAGVFISADEAPPDGKVALAKALTTFLTKRGDLPAGAPHPSFVELVTRAQKLVVRNQ